jgi:phosphonate transport system substrate-binding protein
MRMHIEPVNLQRRSRRLVLKAGVASTCATLLFSSARADSHQIRIGTTPVFLDDQLGFLDSWRHYLEGRLGRPVAFVQRGNYREVTDLILQGAIDCAWLCGYPYVRYRSALQLLVVPTFNGEPLYESYLIVRADKPAHVNLPRMQGRTFAYSDPLSNSGYLVPRYTLWSNGLDPDRHFSRTLFTWSHKKVVQAVAVGLVDGGAVDGYVWETLAKTNPEQTNKTRVAWKSPFFGFPPIVASKNLSPERLVSLRRAFLGMADDPQGAALLAKLNLNGFITAEDKLFDPIEHMLRSLVKAGKAV